MADLIDREDAYIALVEKGQRSRRYKLGDIWELNGDEIRKAFDDVPSADPEIIYCKDCKYYPDCCCEVVSINEYGTSYRYTNINFCSRAERRTDG